MPLPRSPSPAPPPPPPSPPGPGPAPGPGPGPGQGPRPGPGQEPEPGPGPGPEGASRPAGRRPPVPALRRGLRVLQALAGRPGPVSAAALARDLGLARSTVYELLSELAAAGFAVHLADTRRWGLGLAAFEVGSAFLRGQPLERLAGPVLARLSAATAATAHLGVLHGAQTLYLAKERPLRGPSLVTEVGVRLPAALTATGLSMLAALPAAQVRTLFPDPGAFVFRTGRGVRTLPELRDRLAAIRRRGWAVEDGEVSPDTASIAAPVFDHNGMPIAAIGVTVPHRCPAGPADPAGCGLDLAGFATVVRSATAGLTAAIGGRGQR